MADIRKMFASLNNKGGGGDAENGSEMKTNNVAPVLPKGKATKGSIEKTYQKKSQLEHILLRPDTYIGSVEHVTENMWVYDLEAKTMVQKSISYVPGLYKIFDEILVNAADNKQRDKKMDCIKIEIDQENNTVSVWNNGKGIPVAMHSEENMYVPTMIFGFLLTSSNYNDEEEKVTGGRNGYGAKLCNIFSTKFTVETASREYKRNFKQTWGSNMSKASDPKVKDFMGEDYTKVTFSPDLSKFKMEKLDDDIVSLMSRRAFDVAASSRGVKVFLNGTRLPVKNFKDYIDLYIKGEDESSEPMKIIYESCGERWEVAMTLSNRGYQHVSFVNSIATTKGGRHVDYVTDMIVKQVIEVLKKKNKGGVAIKPFQVKNHLWIFLNCLIVNPTFDSQTKENMTLQVKNFGSKCTLTDKFINQVIKSGIVESVLSWAKFKAQTELNKKGGAKKMKLKGIPKLEDANDAGTKNALKCTLILTEGDSAKTLAVSGLGVIGRDLYGVFPLRGKLLNVREATHKQILENAEINNLVKILGLQYKKKYNSEEDMKSLRYGKVMIMTDQDQDGSHIKGLLINFIHYNWPELLKQNFLEEFITPIVKVTKRNEELSFYSLPEFEEWKTNTANHHTYSVKYYKGLGTSTSKEAKEYFTNMTRHRIRFRYGGSIDDDHIVLAFSKKHVEHRKEWLTNFMVDSKRRKEMGLPEKYLYTKETRTVSFADFVNLELVLFSNADNVRSIPSLVDGVKPGQRKVLFTCFKRNDKKEVKVAQLAGSVAEISAYHHGEVSLCMTIVNLAQNFIGSNNINLLEPRGQFGTRLSGGKDSASPRYIFTKMSPLTRMIFHPNDDPLLKHEYDDNQKIEPVWYIPIIPMILVNGADGIGTGWMTKIPNYNPREIVRNLRALLDGEEVTPMIPWYKNFRGTIDDCGDNRFVTSGEVSIIDDDKIEITELPIGTWTQKYKEDTLEPLLHGTEKIKAIISDYKEYNTDSTVRFVLKLLPGQMHNCEKEGFHKIFKLQTVTSTSSMCVFDELGCLRKFESVMDILKEFYTLRLRMYTKRKEHLEGMLEAEASKYTNQARFIMEKCSGELKVENKKRKVIVEELIRRGYNADPVAEWKRQVALADDEEADTPEEEEVEEDAASTTSSKKPVDPEKAFKNLTDVKKFDYLLGMSMWMLTDEKKNELLRQKDNKVHELDILKKKTNSDLWREDLDVFMEKLDAVETKERADEAGTTVKKEKKGIGARKKDNMADTLPLLDAERIVPVIGEELKKKIQNAIKSKASTQRKIKKEISGDATEPDEFDSMVKGKKTLKDKLTKKGDGLKQSKLSFTKVSPGKANGKKKGRKANASDDDEMSTSGSDVEFSSVPVSPVKERTNARRQATKPIQYQFDDDDEDNNPPSDDSELDLKDNVILQNDDQPKEKLMLDNSDSETDSPPPKPTETSDDMFDSLINERETSFPKQAEPPKRKRAPLVVDSDSDDDVIANVQSKKKKPESSEDKPTKRARKPKKKADSGDDLSDDDFATSKKKKGKGKKNSDSDSDFDLNTAHIAEVKSRGRAKKPTKYAEDSDSDY